jgi:hypothetical protein
VTILGKHGGYIRYLWWRWVMNFTNTLRYALYRKQLDTNTANIVAVLRTDGIKVAEAPSDKKLFDELYTTAHMSLREVWDHGSMSPKSYGLDRKGDRASLGRSERKDFLQVLTPRSFATDSIYLRYALQPEFVSIANAYLEQQARLRAIHLWLNYPTEGEAASTQLWHRDGDDFMNLKIFTYLTDVGEKQGPFAFIPGTQPLGRRMLRPEESEHGRTNDEEMRRVVNESDWMICTCDTGSVIYADTCGYHKGVKPIEGFRLMLMVHFASAKAFSGSELMVEEDHISRLANEQLSAIGVDPHEG